MVTELSLLYVPVIQNEICLIQGFRSDKINENLILKNYTEMTYFLYYITKWNKCVNVDGGY